MLRPDMNRAVSDPHTPVRWLPTDDRTEPTAGIGLCLSGGGYRAMLFHVGALRRLNQIGMLGRIDRISSVSGGSITAAALAIAWPKLTFGDDGEFVELVEAPVRAVAHHTIDEPAIFGGVLLPGTIGDHVAQQYRRLLTGDRTLQDLPDQPRFIFNATNLGTGELWLFSKRYMGDWRVGTIRNPELSLADAVAASSAFPPVLSPFVLDLKSAPWETVRGNDITDEAFRDHIVLSDGGVYDNLGLETVWKRCATILVSDAGGETADDADPPRDWILQSVRVLNVLNKDVRAVRKGQLELGLADGTRKGAYWSIQNEVPAGSILRCPPEQTLTLANIPTRLKNLPDEDQERLINWGYAACDEAIRQRFDPSLPEAPALPHPNAGVGPVAEQSSEPVDE